MIVTERERSGFFCPFPRSEKQAFWIGDFDGNNCGCLGNGCMMWRTVDGDIDTGFCGLAGLPAQLRDGGVGQRCCGGPEIIGQPHLSGGEL